MELFVILVLLGAGAVAYLAHLLNRLRRNVLSSLADSEKLRLQLAENIKTMSARARAAEEQATELLSVNRNVTAAIGNLSSEAHRREVEFLRESNAHLQNVICSSAHDAQRRILEIASPTAAEGERRMIPGYRESIKDGFREFPTEDSPVDAIRYPEATRTVQSSAEPPEPSPTTTEAAGYAALQPSPAPQQDFSALADVDEVFRS